MGKNHYCQEQLGSYSCHSSRDWLSDRMWNFKDRNQVLKLRDIVDTYEGGLDDGWEQEYLFGLSQSEI